MKRGALAFCVLCWAGCGGGTPATHESKPVSTVVVPASKDTDEKTDPPVVADDRAPAAADGDFATCIASLRAAPGMSSSGEDRGQYDRALAAERGGDLSTARKSYFELITKWPASKLIPLAYLAFGEMFSAEAVGDPSKWPIAEQAYQEVLKYPPPDNIAFAYASLRHGDATRSSDQQRALMEYTRAEEAAAQGPTLPCSGLIVEEARKRIVESYVRVGAPDKAYSFFVAKNGDVAARAMLRDLATQYKKQGRAKDACQALSAAPSSGEIDALKREACGK